MVGILLFLPAFSERTRGLCVERMSKWSALFMDEDLCVNLGLGAGSAWAVSLFSCKHAVFVGEIEPES